MQLNGRTFALAIWLEAGLGFVGIAWAWALGLPLFDRLEWSPAAVLRGVGATLPMGGLLVLVATTTWRPLVELREQMESLVGELFARSHWLELAGLSLAAGVGEELFFRGALQPWIAGWSSPLLGLVAASLLFGLAHPLSRAYFTLATLMGLYLGWLAMAYGDLVAPIIAHGLYDFVALVYMRSRA